MNRAVIATVSDQDLMRPVVDFVSTLPGDIRELFAIVPYGLREIGEKVTVVMAPGSPRGRDDIDEYRKHFIELLAKTMDAEGNRAFDWVEVFYGEESYIHDGSTGETLAYY